MNFSVELIRGKRSCFLQRFLVFFFFFLWGGGGVGESFEVKLACGEIHRNCCMDNEGYLAQNC